DGCFKNIDRIVLRTWSLTEVSASSVSFAVEKEQKSLPGLGAYAVVWCSEEGQKFLIFPSADHDSDDDSYEVLDLTEYARRHHWWNRLFGRNSGPIVEKYSVATQIVMGGLTGWCAGFLFQKVGKLAATAVGGGFLLLQIASHSGYVQVDWKRVEKDVNKAKKQLKKRANKAAPEINTLIEESTEFIKQNIVVSSGFVGGFLLGLAS
uniref:FUN14 domain containing 1 n=1 Tax=Ficedula albicollis TaxID=59894 RepID=U3JFH8_FICAL